jgi:hypothetical protein
MTNIELAVAGNGASNGKRRRSRYVSKPLSEGNRRRSVRRYDRIVSQLITALGSDLTLEQRGLVEAYAGTLLTVQDFNSRLLLGEKIDLTERAIASTTLVQLAQSLGVVRHEVNKDVALGDAILMKVAASTKQAKF